MTVKGTIISWRRGIITEFKSLAAASEKCIAQESLQISAQLESYSCKRGWMNWERRSNYCGPIPFCSSVLSFLYFFPCEAALVSIHLSVCLSEVQFTNTILLVLDMQHNDSDICIYCKMISMFGWTSITICKDFIFFSVIGSFLW